MEALKLTTAQRHALFNIYTNAGATGLHGASSVKMKDKLVSLGLITLNDKRKAFITDKGLVTLTDLGLR